MARKNNNNLIFVVVIGIIIALGFYYLWSKNSKSSSAENFKSSPNTPEIEFLEKGDNDLIDDFQLIGVADEEPAFQIGFGMGPGLYGSGRHTSEMIGN